MNMDEKKITVKFKYGTIEGESNGEKIKEDYVVAELPEDCLLALGNEGLTIAVPKDFFKNQDDQAKYTVTMAWYEIKIFYKMLKLYKEKFGDVS